MKKFLTLLICVFFSTFIYAQDSLSDCENLMSQLENKYDVKHLTLPDSFLNTFSQDDIIYFDKPSKRSKVPVTTKIDFSQKGKSYRLLVEDISTNCFYQYKATFKVIDYDNQVVQMLKTESDIPALFLYDCDFDGYQDLVLPFVDDDGNKSYYIYYWSQVQRKFSKDSDRLTDPQFDSKHKKIVEKHSVVKGSQRTELYTIYEFRFGIKRFCCSFQLNFVLNGNKEVEDFSFIFWETKEAKDNKIGEYIYELPSYTAFQSYSDKEKKEIRKQYNKMIKMLDVL